MYCFDDILGSSKEINEVKNYAKRVSSSNSPIFIYGETGTGKEMMAQAIHNASRKDKPFIAQNCAAIPENLLESIFFGTSKGSYTGAIETIGLFETAQGGTLYLDELNSMELSFQGKLLRVIQEGELRRLGENRLRKIDVRIVSSVSEEPELLIKTNKLRKDLYYRLNVIRINMPSLEDRKEDIPFLVNGFIDKHNSKCGTKVKGVDKKALELIMKHRYEGNVRELGNIVEEVMISKGSGVIKADELNIKDSNIMSLKEKLEDVERKYIKEALLICDYNISKASNFLKIPRQTLQYKIKKYNIVRWGIVPHFLLDKWHLYRNKGIVDAKMGKIGIIY